MESCGNGSDVRTVPLLVMIALQVVAVPFAFEGLSVATALQNALGAYLYAKFCA